MPTLWDATVAAAIPPTATLVAGYVDGDFPSYWDLEHTHPNAYRVSITVAGAQGARVCDIESGDLTPQGGAAWAAREHMAGRRPTIYCEESARPDVSAALADGGLAFGRDVDCWVAWIGDPIIPTGCVARQYQQNVPGANGGIVDKSVTNGQWPTAPPTPKEPAVAVSPALSFNGQTHVFQVHGGRLYHKWEGAAGTWDNEDVFDKAGAPSVALVNTTPASSILGADLVVTVEDTTGTAWFLLQPPGGKWGVNKLP